MRERLRDVIGSFFVSVTLINMAMFILGLIFRPQQQFGYEVFIYPLLYGLMGCIPALVINVGREMSVKQAVIRKILQMVLITVLMIAMIFSGSPVNGDTVLAASGVALSVIIIFVAVNIITWFLDLRAAAKMTDDLVRFQERQGGQPL